MKQQVADRLFLTSLSFTLVLSAFEVPKSLMFTLVKDGGFYAVLCMIFLAVASTVALLDTVVNDMLPPRFTMKLALGRRRGIWMSLAITFAGIGFIVVKQGYGIPAAIFFLLIAARSAAVAFLDLYYEYRPVIKALDTPVSDSITGVFVDE